MAEKAKWILEVNTKKGILNLKKFGASQDQVTKRMKAQGTQAKKLKSSMGSLQGMIMKIAGGVGLALIARQFLKAADTSEQYEVRLGVLLRSTKEGARLFKEMADYASKVPFQYEEVMGAATTLAGVMKGGVDEVKQWIPLIGDLAAAYGLGFEETAVQVQKMYSAGAGAAERFREKGILAMMGFKRETTYAIQETQEMMFRAWKKTDSQFRGATDALATTWKGATSMMADKWFKFRVMVMDSGPFRALKLIIGGVNSEFDKLVESGQMEKIAESVGSTILSVFEVVLTGTAGLIDSIAIPIGKLIGEIVRGFNTMPKFIREIGLVGALLLGWKGTVTLAAISFVMEKLKELTEEEKNMIKDLTIQQEILDRYNKKLEETAEGYETLQQKAASFLGGDTAKGRYEDLVERQTKVVAKLQKKLAELYPEGAGKEFLHLLGETGDVVEDVQDKIQDFSLLKALARIEAGEGPGAKFAKTIIERIRKAIEVVEKIVADPKLLELKLEFLRESYMDQAKALAGDVEAIRKVAMEKELKDAEDKFTALAKAAVSAGIKDLEFTQELAQAKAEIKKKYSEEELEEEQKLAKEKLTVNQQYEEAIVLSRGTALEARAVARENELEMVRTHYSEMINAMREQGFAELEIAQFVEAQKAILKERYRKEDVQRERELTESRLSLAQNAMGQFTALYRDMAAAGLINSKKTFKLYQTLAVAEAGVSTASAVMKALNESALPFPLNAIWAGTVGAIGAAQIGLILSESPPSYDEGGVSNRPGLYYSGIPEAHIPLKGGAVPVAFDGGRGGEVQSKQVTIQLNNPVFQDQETMGMYMAEIAKMAVELGAPGAIIRNYQNNGLVRDLMIEQGG